MRSVCESQLRLSGGFWVEQGLFCHAPCGYAGARACAHLDILISPVGEVIDARLAHECPCHFPTPWPFAMPYGRAHARVGGVCAHIYRLAWLAENLTECFSFLKRGAFSSAQQRGSKARDRKCRTAPTSRTPSPLHFPAEVAAFLTYCLTRCFCAYIISSITQHVSSIFKRNRACPEGGAAYA